MLLSPAEIQRVQAALSAAFPRFSGWEFVNEINDSYTGFCIWALYEDEPEDLSTPRFYVTLDSFEDTWRGYLTVGKPSYYWSSADVGDAHLVDSGRCCTSDEAISALWARIAGLAAAMLGSDDGPGVAPYLIRT